MFSSIIRNEIWNSGLISTLASPGSKRANEGVIYSKNLKITFCQFFHRILIARLGCFMLKSGIFSKSLVLCMTIFSESTSNERKVLNKTHTGHVHNMGYITKTTYQTAGCLKNISHGTFTRDALSEPVASTILMFPRANCCCSGNSK